MDEELIFARVTKLKPVEGKEDTTSTKSIADFKNDGAVELSPPVDYWVEGAILGQIVIGAPLVVLRESRNGVKIPGLFSTTPITKFTQLDDFTTQLETRNSVYLVEIKQR